VKFNQDECLCWHKQCAVASFQPLDSVSSLVEILPRNDDYKSKKYRVNYAESSKYKSGNIVMKLAFERIMDQYLTFYLLQTVFEIMSKY